MNGTLRAVGLAKPGAPHGGQWVVKHSYPLQDEPIMRTIAWRVTGVRRAGTSPAFAPEMRDGLVVEYTSGEGNWQAYAGGGYLVLATEHDGTATEAPIPAPRCRVETRYRSGRWEKCLTARGWIAA